MSNRSTGPALPDQQPTDDHTGDDQGRERIADLLPTTYDTTADATAVRELADAERAAARHAATPDQARGVQAAGQARRDEDRLARWQQRGDLTPDESRTGDRTTPATADDHASMTSTENWRCRMDDNHISDPRARSFVAALRRFEQDSDPAVLTELFTPDATLTRLDARGERTDATAFWREYRAQFHDLSTTFTGVVEGADQFALEWTSEATLTDDRPLTYRGVTVIDLDGEKIARLRTYYDTAAFTPTPAGTS